MSTDVVTINRRALLGAFGSLLAVAAAGCTTTHNVASVAAEAAPAIPAYARLMYAAVPDEEFPVEAVDLTRLDPLYYRQVVAYHTAEKPGTVIVDTENRVLYHVRDGGTAMRYGVGIGRAGFAWSGRAHIAYKRKWPVWTPPNDMIRRQPELEKWRRGQPPGPSNPLGARALYIHRGNEDTLYRLHGTSEAWTIGKAISSGCVRLLHQDIIDLYERVQPGAPMVVLAPAVT